MALQLTDAEVRVLGALVEKEITTPEYYPLSVNALMNACNQKSNREPVMSLDEEAVRKALRSMSAQALVRSAGVDSRVSKFEHRLNELYNFHRHEIAVLCVLMLRPTDCVGIAYAGGTDVRLRRFGCCSCGSESADASRAGAGESVAETTGNKGVAVHAFAGRGRGGKYGCGSEATGEYDNGWHGIGWPGADNAARGGSPRVESRVGDTPATVRGVPEAVPIIGRASLSPKDAVNDSGRATVHAAFLERNGGFLESKDFSGSKILTKNFGPVQELNLFGPAGGEL